MPISSHRETPSAKAQSEPIALFVSDIHLSEALPKTTTSFLNFLNTHAIRAEHVYLLGDLFEYWAGDDDCDSSYHQQIIQALRTLTDRGVQMYWIAGNRDFLIGEHFASLTGIQMLNDPCQLQLAGRQLLVSHGDALCTDDVDYMAFRSVVRQSAWQAQFLTKPLSERKAIIEGMRHASNSEQQNKSMAIMDVNLSAVSKLHQQFPNSLLIHGHTHRTALHHEAEGLRYVLPDWDCDHADKPRGGWLQLTPDGILNFVHL